MKTYSLLTLVVICFLLIGFSISVTGCGKKGDLIRPVPPNEQQSQQEKPVNMPKNYDITTTNT